MDYKSTLNLPKTSFPMKGNLASVEPKVLAQWEQDRLYERILSSRRGADPFILHDGPPYANGDIHIGHALNKVLKDFIVRYKTMQGRWSPYVPGWDCHGLPIEYALMKELKITKHQVNIVDFRRKARAYAQRYVAIQRDQFKRLGVQGDWDHPYLTLEPGYVAAALRALAALVSKGFVYRARKPVNWCWSCETALAEAEVEYEQHTSPSIYVKFELDPESTAQVFPKTPMGSDPRKVFLIIWTTTPWTLMGNVAVAVHPSFRYVARKIGPGQVGLFLENLPASTQRDLEKAGIEPQILNKFEGKQMEGWTYRHPFGLKGGRVVLADYVSAEDGTGLVHTAPGFGAEDFLTGKKYGLELLAPVDSKGQFAGLPKEAAQFNGQQVQKANPAVIELLQKSGLLVKAGKIEHPYPHCWRCREPIIFRATDQWFLNVEHQGLRERLLKIIHSDVQWVPPVGRERIAGMVKTRPDWCLSRQRLWGIPIPAVICASCGEGRLDPQVIEKFASAVEKDPEGSDRWFSEPAQRWLPDGFTCKSCGKKDFSPGTDILDVWFDSGVSHQGVLVRREGLRHPADLYLEGSDQHRGWFQVSLITGAALNGRAPYRAVLTHGFVVDGEGRKMSKSLGNVIAPQQVISSFGADVLRLWVASSDYAEDIRLSPVILDQVAETYRKIRNTIRFCLANISDLNLQELPKNKKNLESLDRWILGELGLLVAEVNRAYEAYAFHRVVKAVHEFCTVRLSNFYLDIVKDTLYTAHPKDPRRLSAQAALHSIARTLILLLAPLLPVTVEEAWAALIGGEGSVHLQSWPSPDELPLDPSLQEEWTRLLALREEAMKALEKGRESGLIGDALEAELEVVVRDENLWGFLELRREQLAQACIVSVLQLVRAQDAGPGVVFHIRKASGAKCQRCWMRLPTVGQSAEHLGLCHRCLEVLQKLLPGGKL